MPPSFIGGPFVLPPQTIMRDPVQTAVKDSRPRGEFAPTLVVVHVLVFGSYTPPVLSYPTPDSPPQTIILEPVHTAACKCLAFGTGKDVEVAVQVLVAGS